MPDERDFTPFAQAGWESWDSYSPEVDFCRFVGMLQRMLQPKVIVETGAGIGRITEQLDRSSCLYLGFESDPEWRQDTAVPDMATPAPAQVAIADLLIFDSAPAFRVGEIALWGLTGKPGSVCVVHDCGNGHSEQYETHHQMRAAVEATGHPGVFLKNPRGSWLGFK